MQHPFQCAITIIWLGLHIAADYRGRMRKVFILLLLLAACGRGITPAERVLMGEIMGDTFDPRGARMVEAGFIGVRTREYAVRPQVTCRERINAPPISETFTARTAGAVAWTHVLTNPDWTLPNYAPNYPEEFNLHAVMYFAHEMTHIWQWQNRGLTRYSPFKGAAEHRPGADPYLFDPEDEIDFLSMGYEQQAVLVEEFICCRTLAPNAARTHRLYEVLLAVMPVQHPTQTPVPLKVTGVYENADLSGICD